jgi:molybdopterin guanine dinucleotide-containing S/N-oxide reductase-like protein
MPEENIRKRDHTVTKTTIGKEGQGKTLIKNFSFCAYSMGSNVACVDVKNGRIVRIRPLHYDEKYRPEEFRPWELAVRGKVFQAAMKEPVSPLGLGYKKRVYSPNRIKYPLKRVDWNPDGERNPQNRGISKFKRISWDEATNIVAGELKRVQQKYGKSSIYFKMGNHGETKCIHGTHGIPARLLKAGYTEQHQNPDSWEGWYWGAQHVWGMDCPWTKTLSVGMMAPQTNVIKDLSENTQMLLFIGCDPETTPWGFQGQGFTRWCYWWTELGIKQVYVCPDLNYGAAVHADKWIPVLPNTDAALLLATAHTWITEGTYDKGYVSTHTFGFDRFADYVLGKEDGQPKTPEWASPLCGVPEWTIKALARKWAASITSTIHVAGGSYQRGPYATEPARLEVLLLAMQGVGKPGVHQASLMGRSSTPPGVVIPSVRSTSRGSGTPGGMATSGDNGKPKQAIYKTLLHQAILNSPITWYATSGFMGPLEDQFNQYHYPVEGGSEIHMIWSDDGSFTAGWNGGNRLIDAFRSPKIEFILAQHPWLEDDCLYADIILPVNTKMEEEDIGTGYSNYFDLIFLEGKCTEPIGESRSDYEVVGEIAKKLGKYEEFTEGKTVEEWIKVAFENSGVSSIVSWEELNEKGYYVVPPDPDWKKAPAGMIEFYKNPDANPLHTRSGKIEFYGQWLAEHFPGDPERPPVPHWIPGGVTHQESRQSERAKKYPLLIVSNHSRWRMHVEHDDVTWLREIPTCKVKGRDGYLYEPVWMNPEDAASRSIQTGDVVRIYNERGAVLGGAFVTERIIAGAVLQDHGARLDPITTNLDRGGSNNLISPVNTTSKNACGQATSGYLIEVEKVSIAQLEEWKKQYPEAFEREYDPASGLRVDGWIE